jgi:hypothetical protein
MFARNSAIRRLDVVIEFYCKCIRWYARKHLVPNSRKRYFREQATDPDEKKYLNSLDV